MKIIIIMLALLFSAKAFCQVDPSIDWKVIDDPHALWVYDSRHKPLVLQYRRNFKKIFPLLQEMFEEFPSKTTFVISDHTDLPNGSATVFPYPLVMIYPVIPIPTSGIGETNDSFFEILTHEYTHILNLHPVHGSMKLLNYIFGSIVHPNFLLPRWYVEGLAVYSESYFNPRGGRLRSQNFEAMVRALSLGKKWGEFSIDQLIDGKPDWVGGQRPYLLGGALMHHIFTTYGDKNIYSLNRKYSRRVPFLINSPVEEATGKNYAHLLAETYLKLDEQAKRQLSVIASTKTTRGTPLPEQGFNSYRPQISPDGNFLAFISSRHNIRSGLYLVPRNTNNDFSSKPILIDSGDGITHFAWSPDSQFIVYNKIGNYDRYYRISDLHVYSLKGQDSQQITEGQRVGDMTFANSPSQLFFIQNQTGYKQLSHIDLLTKKISLVYKPDKLGTNLFALTSKGNKLLFVEKNHNDQWLRLLDASKAETPKITARNVPITFLYWTGDNLLFTSNQSGVDNLYIVKNFDLNKQWRAVPLTNSKTRIITGDIDPRTNALYYSELTPDGMKIMQSPAENWQQVKKIPTVRPLLDIPVPPSYQQAPQEDPTKVPLHSTDEPIVVVSEAVKEENFYPFRYLLPRYWMPFGFILDGGMGFTATTTGGDPLLKNSYTLTAQWDTLTERLGAAASYTNNSTPVSLTLGVHNLFRYNRVNDSALKDSGGTVGLQTFIPYLSNNWNWGLDWKYSETELNLGEVARSGPSAFIYYRNVAQRGYEISPESGGAGSLYHQVYLEDAGDIGYEKTNLNLQYYFSHWLPDRHVLYLQVNGTYAPDLEDLRIFGGRPTAFYTDTIGGNFVANSLIPPFLMRGYTSGNLLGYNVLSTNLEYRFPISYINKGSGTTPIFWRTISGSLVFDGISLDGFRYSTQGQNYVPAEFGKFYWGTGAELHLDTTLAYYLPIRFTLGVYYGLDSDLNESDFSTFFSFSM